MSGIRSWLFAEGAQAGANPGSNPGATAANDDATHGKRSFMITLAI